MRRWLMILLTAIFVIGAAVPDAEARSHHRTRHSSRHGRKHAKRSSSRRRNFSRRVSRAPGTLTQDSERLESQFKSESKKPFLEGIQALRDVFK